ncbi:MAG: hypothetical protein M1541_06330, partial [Acidobacteria bacterium]|nr:hypothetical protein [Acidobacteriota bacterium]
VIWSVAQDSEGNLYAATGHRGRIYRIDRSGKSSILWTADEPEVFALAVDAQGVLYAGTAPDGKVYRIENGKAAEYFAPGARYIWSLVAAPDGVLYVGTGDRGLIYRVTSANKGEVYYDTGQSHITGMCLDAQGRLLAGTEPNGILYRISAKDKAFVLYDANLPEVRAIVPAADGSIYAAALGGSIAKRLEGAAQAGQSGATAAPVTAAPVSITVEANAQDGPPIKTQPEAAKPAQPAPTPQVTTQFTPVVDLAGVEKSAVYKINPDNTVETIWTSKEENVYDVLSLPDRLLISTDGSGRIYSLAPDRKVRMLLQTNQTEATRLLPSRGSVLAATGNMGRIYRLGDTPGASGTFESPVHDSGTVARWGTLQWHSEDVPGTGLTFRTRSGNSARPDRTWSDWSGPLTGPGVVKVTSPNARYIQWKAELAGSGGATPSVESVTLAYLPQNSPPMVKSINVTTQPAATVVKATPQAATAAYTVTVTDTGDATTGSAGTPTQTLSRAASQQISVTWQAEDPDGDRLVYSVYFRGEDESEWKPLKQNLHENVVNFDGDVLADGKYFFRVTASDREANPPSTARDAELVSAPVMIDNTPPVLTVAPVKKAGNRVELQFEASDAASPLRHCEYSLDAGTWIPIEAGDGVIDSRRESFVLRLDNLTPGEHLLVLRVADSANNSGLAKVVVK